MVDVDGVDTLALQRVALQVQRLGAGRLQRGRRRSACVVNGRLRHTGTYAYHIPCLILCRANVRANAHGTTRIKLLRPRVFLDT